MTEEYQEAEKTKEIKHPSAKRANLDDPMLGRVLEDRYRLLSKLGQGGMGSVYLADDQRLKIQVAIKLIASKSGDTNQIGLQRFRFEAHAAARIRSEHVVRVSDFGVCDLGSFPIAYIAMEYLQGENLGHYMDRHMRTHGPLPWTRAKQLITEIAKGLASVHEAGLVHRDMKPSNCFLAKGPGGQEQIKIFDFGIAKSMETNSEQLTREGIIMGTMAYMAPEQASGKKIDRRTDIYSLGAILFQMLCGRPPFTSVHWQELLAQIIHAPAPRLSEFVDVQVLPTKIEDILLQSLQKTPDDRFRDIAAFVSALESLNVPNVPNALTWQAKLHNSEPSSKDATKTLVPARPTTTIAVPPPQRPSSKTKSLVYSVAKSSVTPPSKARPGWIWSSTLGCIILVAGVTWQGDETQDTNPLSVASASIVTKSGTLAPSNPPETTQTTFEYTLTPTPPEQPKPSLEGSLPSEHNEAVENKNGPGTSPSPENTNEKATNNKPPVHRKKISTPPKKKPFANRKQIKRMIVRIIEKAKGKCTTHNPTAKGREAQLSIEVGGNGRIKEFNPLIASNHKGTLSAANCVGRTLKSRLIVRPHPKQSNRFNPVVKF